MLSVLKKITRRHVLWTMIAIGALVAMVFIFDHFRAGGIDNKIQRMDDGWTVTQNGHVYEDQFIDVYKFPEGPLGYMDSITFSKRFVFKGRPPYMFRIKANHAAVRVQIEDWTVFMYGYDRLMQHRYIGSGVFSVPVPYTVNGKVLNVTFYGGFRQPIDRVSTFEMLSTEVAYTDYMARHAYSLYIGIFLVVLGFLGVIFGLVANGFNKTFYRFVLIGALSLLVGVWSMCYSKVAQVCSLDFVTTSFMEYLCLYMIPIPFLLLLQDMHKGKLSPKKWMFLKIVTIASIVFVVVTSVLHLMNIALMMHFLTVFHVFVCFLAVYTLGTGLVYNKKMGLSERIFALGIVIFFVVGMLDVTRFQLQHLFLFSSDFMSMTWTPWGALLFILCLIVAYIVYAFEAIAAKAEKDVLAELAYKDVLTGLFNRTKCEQIFDVLDQEDGNYAIISIDMNGLKVVNDSHGHTNGDRLICRFADVLRDSVAGIGTAVRMGGDEFVVIIRESHLAEMHIVKERMDVLAKQYSKDLPVELEASYGVALRNEFSEGKAKDVYRAADERMYTMKKNSKSKLVRR